MKPNVLFVSPSFVRTLVVGPFMAILMAILVNGRPNILSPSTESHCDKERKGKALKLENIKYNGKE